MKLLRLLGLLAILAAGCDFADGSTLDRACLAVAGYTEARSDGDAGMTAVMLAAV